MLKILAAVATGILLLTLPAVATPQAPAPEDCTAVNEKEAAEERAEAEGGYDEPEEECVRQEQSNQEGGNAVGQLSDALLGSGGSGGDGFIPGS
jgi:hypothetical protein